MLFIDHLRSVSRADEGVEKMTAGEILLLIQSEMKNPEEGAAAHAQQERIRKLQFIHERKLRECLKR